VAKEKKNKEEEEVDVDPRVELDKLINKKYSISGIDGTFIKEHKKLIIPSTPALDIELHGGIPEGSWTLISGKKKTGKTTMAMQIAANAQRMGKYVYYMNVEHRFDEKNLTTVRHFSTDSSQFKLYQSKEGVILSAQDFLNMTADIMSKHKGCVVILDSISSLCSDNELLKDIGEAARPEGPKMFGQFCRKMASTVPINKITFIGILHLIANTSGYGPAFMEDGGNKIQYQTDTKLLCKGASSWDIGSDDNKKKIGQIVDWEVTFSALGPPGGVAKSYLRYGYGYDDAWEIMNIAIDLNIILKSGNWFYPKPEDETIKFQGQPKLHQYLVDNPQECDLLYQKIKESVM
jgi:recombination protein RecA